MLLTIDVGNSNIVFGLFNGKKLLWVRRCLTSNIQLPTSKQLRQNGTKISKVTISSVVPAIDQRLKREVQKLWGIKPHFVTAENIQGIKVKLKNKKEIGADRVVDALAAYKLYGGPVIVVDFGTATTFDVISAKGEYLGGAIAPGVLLARDALHEQTAKLPRIAIKAPRSVIGNDTLSAMQSGLVYGYVAMVEGMVERIKSKIPSDRDWISRTSGRGQTSKSQTNHKSKSPNLNPKVIATGGLARLICKESDIVDKIDDNLTLEGLRLIGETNG